MALPDYGQWAKLEWHVKEWKNPHSKIPPKLKFELKKAIP